MRLCAPLGDRRRLQMEEFWDLTFMRRASGTSGGSHSPQQSELQLRPAQDAPPVALPVHRNRVVGPARLARVTQVIEEEGGC